MRSTCAGPARAAAPAGRPPRPPQAGAPARARHSPRDPGRVVHLRRASVSPAGDRARWVRPRGGRCLRPAGPPTVSTLLPQEPSRARAAPAPTRAGAGDAGKFQRRRGSSRDAAPGGKRIRRARQTATGGFAEEGRGGGHAAGERQTPGGRAVVGSEGPPGAEAEAGARGPEARRRGWHSGRGGRRGRGGGLDRAAAPEGQGRRPHPGCERRAWLCRQQGTVVQRRKQENGSLGSLSKDVTGHFWTEKGGTRHWSAEERDGRLSGISKCPTGAASSPDVTTHGPCWGSRPTGRQGCSPAGRRAGEAAGV